MAASFSLALCAKARQCLILRIALEFLLVDLLCGHGDSSQVYSERFKNGDFRWTEMNCLQWWELLGQLSTN